MTVEKLVKEKELLEVEVSILSKRVARLEKKVGLTR